MKNEMLQVKLMMSYNYAYGKKQKWYSLDSDQSIIDATRISRTLTLLERSLTEFKRPERI